jgi:hypothetical protein
MGWMGFVAQCEVCLQSAERAVPLLREKYRDVTAGEIFHTVGKDRILDKSKELRGDIDNLSLAVARMYEEATEARNIQR